MISCSTRLPGIESTRRQSMAKFAGNVLLIIVELDHSVWSRYIFGSILKNDYPKMKDCFTCLEECLVTNPIL